MRIMTKSHFAFARMWKITENCMHCCQKYVADKSQWHHHNRFRSQFRFIIAVAILASNYTHTQPSNVSIYWILLFAKLLSHYWDQQICILANVYIFCRQEWTRVVLSETKVQFNNYLLRVLEIKWNLGQEDDRDA